MERVTEYTYYSDGNVESVIRWIDNNTSVMTRFEYDALGRITKEIDPEGHETVYTYDTAGQIKTVTTIQGMWQYEYNEDGQMTTITDPFGNTTEREYNADGNLLVVRINGEIETSYTYENGNLVQRADRAGNVYTFEYNTNDQRIREIDPEGREQRYEYDTNGRLFKRIDGNGNEIVYEYGGTVGAGSSCPSCTSSETGRLSRLIYPTYAKAFRYDNRDRTIEEVYELNTGETYSTSFTYDQLGRLHIETDKNGNTTTYTYDVLGRKIIEEDVAGQTQYTYDRWDNVIAITDANDQTTRFEYDLLGRVTKEIRPMDEETTYEYDAQGRLWKIIDANDQLTEYGYNTQGRVETVTRSATPSSPPGSQCTFTYDADGNLKTYNDGVTSAVYNYDELGQKTQETVNYGTFTLSYSYTYYKNGLKKTFTGPDGITYEYIYGANNELRGIQIPGLGTVAMPDYTWNKPVTLDFPGGSQKTYVYDSLMRIQALNVADSGQNHLMTYQYTYDAMNNVLTKETEHGTYTYSYDDMYQLLSADNPVLNDESYTYDAVGNRLTDSGVTGNWTYNDNNELLGYGNVEYVYDENGNVIQKLVDGQIVMSFFYNLENRLVKIEDGNSQTIAEYDYDPFGRRLWKEVNEVRTYFFYAEEGLVAEYDSNGTVLKTYGYRPDSLWTTAPIFLKQGTDHYFYQNDHLETPMKLIGTNGIVVWSAQYQTFGQAEIDPSSSVENNLQLPGQYYDEETGLHYNYHRYYEPNIGRYLRVDPIGFMGENVNLYKFVDNNPLNWIDPLGLRVIYLVFDDPPIGGTGVVLAALKEAGIKATFFLVGEHIETISKQQVDDIVAARHTIGNHSYSHWYKKSQLKGKTPAHWVADFEKAEKIIFETTGMRPKLARIPGNKPEWKKDIAEALRTEGWDPRGWDWEIGGQGADPRNCEENVEIIHNNPTYVHILMHPQHHRYSGAKEDLVCFIQLLKEKGHTFAALPYTEKQ